jgi:hypothetical protein
MPTGRVLAPLANVPFCHMGIRAFKRTNGEYLVFTENSGYGGRSNFYRRKP